MPPRVTYWTGTWDPAKEANSKEINLLRAGFDTLPPVVAFSPANSVRWQSRARVLTLSAGAWPLLRVAAAVIEPRGEITHVFGGGGGSWHLFRALGRRPMLLTAVGGHAGGRDLPGVARTRVVVEAETAVDAWVENGVPRQHIDVVYPGVDLAWHGQVPVPESGRFTLLFGSTPSDPAEFCARGLPLLVDLARQRPDVDVLIPWRQWGDIPAARQALAALRPPSNFLVEHADAPDMRVFFARAHATVVPFAKGGGKSCPNFVVEGLACGRPCLATSDVGIAGLIARTGAGVVALRDVSSLAEALDSLRAGWAGYARAARALAVATFGEQAFLDRYRQIYGEVAGEGTRQR